MKTGPWSDGDTRLFRRILPVRLQSHTMGALTQGYRTVRGSDVQRDGMFLELIDESTGDEVAEVFYSDVTRKMTISVFRPELPLEVELLIERAKHELLPTTAA